MKRMRTVRPFLSLTFPHLPKQSFLIFIFIPYLISAWKTIFPQLLRHQKAERLLHHIRLSTSVHSEDAKHSSIASISIAGIIPPPSLNQTISVAKRETVDILLDEKELEESFVKGSGKGGQKINKTMNRVVLVHKPTGLRVSCQEVRDLDTNRKIARELLKGKLDVYFNQEQSKLRIEQQKIRKRKSDASRKSKRKYSNLSAKIQSSEPMPSRKTEKRTQVEGGDDEEGYADDLSMIVR